MPGIVNNDGDAGVSREVKGFLNLLVVAHVDLER